MNRRELLLKAAALTLIPHAAAAAMEGLQEEPVPLTTRTAKNRILAVQGTQVLSWDVSLLLVNPETHGKVTGWFLAPIPNQDMWITHNLLVREHRNPMRLLLLDETGHAQEKLEGVRITGFSLEYGMYQFAADRAVLEAGTPSERDHQLMVVVPKEKLESPVPGRFRYDPQTGTAWF